MTESSIKEVLNYGTALLSDFESARLDCELLLCGVLGTEREYIYAHPEKELSSSEKADFNLLVNSRCSGFPVAYLTGYKEFWSLRLQVDHSTLIPRPETEHLVEIALSRLGPEPGARILDLGTGSGAIAIAMAKERPEDLVTACDVSTDSLLMAALNARENSVKNIEFLHSDWFTALSGRHFDLILANPPYVESMHGGFLDGEIRFEPRLALDGGPSGLDAYHRIIPGALRHLDPDGVLILEHGIHQGEIIRTMLSNAGYQDIKSSQDYAGIERVTFGITPS